MKRSAFTLVELLMVIMIMGLLGTLTVGGYRAMQRGMEERGVMENVNHFIRAAYRRAQIDKKPVAVYFWNETLQVESETEPLVVVGKAVAVRRVGRVTKFKDPFIFDEFGDLDKERLLESDEDEENENANSGAIGKDNLVPLYKMNSKNDSERVLVSQTTKWVTDDNSDILLSTGETKKIPCYAYVLNGNGDWHIGDAYGLEFAEIQLPHGYIFEKDCDKSTITSEPRITKKMWFDVDGAGTDSVVVYSLRPGQSGELDALSVDASGDPSKGIN